MRTIVRVIGVAFLWLVMAAGTSAQSNWAVAADERGAIYFCDIQRDNVWRYEPQGNLRLLFDHNHCHTLVLGYDGQVYGENVGGESRAGEVVGLWRLTPQGERTFLFPLTARPDPSVWLVRDGAGNGYAWDGNPATKEQSRILKRTPQGETQVIAGQEWGFADGPGSKARFTQVAGMAAMPDGTLFVADDGNLRQVSAEGTVSTLARGIASNIAGGLPWIGGLYNHHMGVAVDAHGSVYVVDYGRRHIIRWDAMEGTRVVFESRGVANWLSRGGWGRRPTGVAVDGNSLLVMEDWSMPTFVAELIGNPRISRISPDGKAATVVAVASSPARALAAILLTAVGIAFIAWRRAIRCGR